MKRKILIIAGIVTAFLLAASYEVYAMGPGRVVSRTSVTYPNVYGIRVTYSTGGSYFVPTGVTYSNSTRVGPSMHIAPPGFPYEWFAKDAAESFRKNGLKINTASAAKDEHPKAKECMKIYVTSKEKNLEGCILTFEKREDLEAEQKHYLALNEKGELHNWSFVKDNILLVLDGSVSEEEARLYESSLSAMSVEK